MDAQFPPVKRWQPPPRPARRPRKKKPPAWLAPFAWWGRHPWVIVWMSVFLAPFMVLFLRVVDESWSPRLVVPFEWMLWAFFAIALLLGLLVTSTKSAMRAVGGLVFALLAIAVLVAPLTQVTLGRGGCPARIGKDLGLGVAATVLEAWQKGEALGEAWHGGEVAPSWQERAHRLALLDYRLVESGCWERVAPIATSTTWHEFRVTVKEGDRAPLSKTLLVHTVREGAGFKVSAVDGPLP